MAGVINTGSMKEVTLRSTEYGTWGSYQMGHASCNWRAKLFLQWN